MTIRLMAAAQRVLTVGLLTALAACSMPAASRESPMVLPPPTIDTSAPANQGDQVAVLAGGCFWGMEAVFDHVKGVKQVWAAYSGGNAGTAHYDQVSGGNTGHAESVKIIYDPAQISYGRLLQVYFSVAHDPTQLNRQGPDRGSQYRSAIFYGNAQQQQIASAYIAQLTAARAFAVPIVTQVIPLKAVYAAENYHQDYARLHPDDAYIVYNDAPKVVHLKQLFPALYQPDHTVQNVVDVQLH